LTNKKSTCLKQKNLDTKLKKNRKSNFLFRAVADHVKKPTNMNFVTKLLNLLSVVIQRKGLKQKTKLFASLSL
jgi:hypothetical protein